MADQAEIADAVEAAREAGSGASRSFTVYRATQRQRKKQTSPVLERCAIGTIVR